MSRSKKFRIAIGVFAHNEEKNISRTLDSLEKQILNEVEIQQIIVVSSGSFDKTNSIVRQRMKKNLKIQLIDEIERKGKSAAINAFLQKVKADYIVTISADLRLHKDALEELLIPFHNSEVGMTGARPVPSNTRSSEIGDEISLLWELHHQISMIKPKCGEMVAFRNVIREIPLQSAVDEATIEVLLQLVGYKTVYAPRSIVYNKGPKTVKQFMTQRRRVYAGHQWVSVKYNYKVVTMNLTQIFRVVLLLILNNPTYLKPMSKLVSMEAIARLLGWIDFHVFNRNPYIWRMIER